MTKMGIFVDWVMPSNELYLIKRTFSAFFFSPPQLSDILPIGFKSPISHALLE